MRNARGTEPQRTEARERSGLLWYPTSTPAARHDYQGQIGFVAFESTTADGEHPLLAFSHGFLGSADQTIFLMEEFARRGCIVAAINHADGLKERKRGPMEWPRFADVNSWDDKKFRDRRDDLSALVDEMLRLNGEPGGFLERHVRKDAIGAMGHSLGGYTVLGMVGGWPDWRDERIRAALLLSPYTMPLTDHGDLPHVTTPVMFQGGTLDWGITPFLAPAFAKLESARYFLVLKNETHLGWTNLISLGRTTREAVASGNARLMTEYGVAFFDRHLLGKAPTILDRSNPELDSYRHDAD